MEYAIKEMVIRKGRSLAETDYACSPPDMLNFRLISEDFYEWNGGKLRFKECVDVMDVQQAAEAFPLFAGVSYKSRENSRAFRTIWKGCWRRGNAGKRWRWRAAHTCSGSTRSRYPFS